MTQTLSLCGSPQTSLPSIQVRAEKLPSFENRCLIVHNALRQFDTRTYRQLLCASSAARAPPPRPPPTAGAGPMSRSGAARSTRRPSAATSSPLITTPTTGTVTATCGPTRCRRRPTWCTRRWCPSCRSCRCACDSPRACGRADAQAALSRSAGAAARMRSKGDAGDHREARLMPRHHQSPSARLPRFDSHISSSSFLSSMAAMCHAGR
jgi:hypothetical protein